MSTISLSLFGNKKGGYHKLLFLLTQKGNGKNESSFKECKPSQNGFYYTFNNSAMHLVVYPTLIPKSPAVPMPLGSIWFQRLDLLGFASGGGPPPSDSRSSSPSMALFEARLSHCTDHDA
jgi:hypothetical protein